MSKDTTAEKALRTARLEARVLQIDKDSIDAAAKTVDMSTSRYLVRLHKHKSVEFIKEFTPKPDTDKKA